MDRYQHIIRFGVFGHNHGETYAITQSFNDLKNIGFNYNCGSVTPMTGRNPVFAVLELDAEFLVPVNIKSYYFDLVKANNGNPKWELLHDVIEEYGVKDTSPDGFFDLA